MEVSGRANKVVARIVQSHQQTGRSGSRREKVRERSHPRAGTVDNNTSPWHYAKYISLEIAYEEAIEK